MRRAVVFLSVYWLGNIFLGILFTYLSLLGAAVSMRTSNPTSGYAVLPMVLDTVHFVQLCLLARGTP